MQHKLKRNRQLLDHHLKTIELIDQFYHFELEPELRHNIAHLDLFFIRGVCFIVAVLDPMKYCWVEHLPNKNADSIRVSLERFLAEMKSRRVRVSMVRCDNEGGVWAQESWLKDKGIMMDKVAPGAHCEIAERKIQQIKEGTRRGCSGLPYLLCRKLLIACVIYATKAINIQRTNGQIKRGGGREHALPISIWNLRGGHCERNEQLK